MNKLCYKLFRIKDGELYPLYVDTKTTIPLNTVVTAIEGEKTARGKVKSKLGELAYRPGYHCCSLPLADHIGRRMDNGKLCQADDSVWCKVMIIGEDLTEKVRSLSNSKNPRDWCLKELPKNGYYSFRTNPSAKVDWYIAEKMIVLEILTHSQVVNLCRSNRLEPQITEYQYNAKKLGMRILNPDLGIMVWTAKDQHEWHFCDSKGKEIYAYLDCDERDIENAKQDAAFLAKIKNPQELSNWIESNGCECIIWKPNQRMTPEQTSVSENFSLKGFRLTIRF